MRIRTFTDDGQYYFEIQSNTGQPLVTSRAYPAEARRDEDAQWALTHLNDEDYYLVSEAEDGWQYRVQNAEQTTIASSATYASRAELNAAFSFLNAATTVAGTPYQGRNGDDDYEPLSFYQENGSDLANGFDRFTAGGSHYFTYKVGGVILLISEAYTSARSRDNGTDSVTRNMTVAERYQRQVHPTGNRYFNLLAGNRQEIATSVWFRTDGEMENAIRILLAGGRGGTVRTEVVAANRSANIAIAAAAAPAGTEPPKKRKKRKKRTTPKPKTEKVYLASGTYLFNELTYQIFRSGNGRHYFTFKNAEGKTVLLNANVRGYETEAEAQAAVDRILAVGPYERNFEGKTTKNGKYYYYLKDEDGKNLGKSFFFDTTEAMQASVGLFLGSEIATATFNEGEATTATAATAATGAIATSEVASEDEKAVTKRPAFNVDEYPLCGFYDGHGRSEQHPEFSVFERNGKFYFAMLDQNGKVLLRSERYESARGRDNGLQSVLKNRGIEKRWSTERHGDEYFAVLKAGNHQEIARSCPEKSEAFVAGFWGPYVAAGAALAASGIVVPPAKPVVLPPPELSPPTERSISTPAKTDKPQEKAAETGALGAAALGAAAAAAGQSATPPATPPTPPPPAPTPPPAATTPPPAVTPPPVATPPERAAATASADSGFNWAWLLLLIPLLLLLLWMGGCFDGKDATAVPPSDEVISSNDTGTSTDGTDTDGETTGIAATDPTGDEADTKGREPGDGQTATGAVPSSSTDDDPVSDDDSATENDAVGDQDDANADSGGNSSGADGTNTTAGNTGAGTTSPAAPVAGNADCGCASRRPIFRASGTPRTIDRLGTLPEFGNSHDLTPAQFYVKLQDRYASNDTDRAYLDYLYRSMGYAGFSAANADQFSNAVIPAGTSGVLGFAEYHGYGHYTLNTNERDRQAFRLRAANGCTVHFMKTCGNYFYYCEE